MPVAPSSSQCGFISNSYKFVSFVIQCARMPMETLTLSRYILESSLMDYIYAQTSDSKLAAAALLLAMKMKKCEQWVRFLRLQQPCYYHS